MANPSYWPETLCMSGFPFWMQGWNTHFHLTAFDSDNMPIYSLSEYRLYNCISIIGCTIQYDKPRRAWTFTRNGDPSPYFTKSKSGMQNTPFGRWGTNSRELNVIAYPGESDVLFRVRDRIVNILFSPIVLGGALFATGWWFGGGGSN